MSYIPIGAPSCQVDLAVLVRWLLIGRTIARAARRRPLRWSYSSSQSPRHPFGAPSREMV